jgi:DNA-binding MurR/RpiR family transcriptional regulator
MDDAPSGPSEQRKVTVTGVAPRQAQPGPRTLSLRVRLAALASSPNEAQQKIALFLLDRYYVASDYAITELAAAAGVSTGTVSTLCKSLGLRGYSELRFALAREAVAQQMSDRDSRGRVGEEPAPVSDAGRAIRDAFGADILALTETEAAIEPAELDRAATLIRNAVHVEVVGIASSAAIASEAALKMRKVGVRASFEPDLHVQAMSAAQLGPGDVLLAISHSGRTAEILRSAKLARRRGASVIAVVCVGPSPLRGLADVVLPVVAHDTAFRVEPAASSIAALAIVHALFLLLFGHGQEAADSYQRTLDAVIDRERRQA